MKKVISMILVGIIMFSALTIAANANEFNTMPARYCGPNDIKCQGPEIDIVFVIDSTGSMYDEIRTVKEEVVNIMHRINSGYPQPDVKVGVVTYRDYEPEEREYLTKEKWLTSDIDYIEDFVRNIGAQGGGDYEEAVEAGLEEAINNMNWRKNSEKIIILVGDAPARDYYYAHYRGNEIDQSYQYNWRDAIEDAEDKNIRIFTASGSGMNREGINMWKEIARKTGGSYINLIYERRNIREHYIERDIDFTFMSEAKTSADYDASTDSIMTNNLGSFAGGSIQAIAEDAGVRYDGSLEDITGEIIKEQQTNFRGFLERIFSRLAFWK
jgi:Mg-chelatase subunit ChlD